MSANAILSVYQPLLSLSHFNKAFLLQHLYLIPSPRIATATLRKPTTLRQKASERPNNRFTDKSFEQIDLRPTLALLILVHRYTSQLCFRPQPLNVFYVCIKPLPAAATSMQHNKGCLAVQSRSEVRFYTRHPSLLSSSLTMCTHWEAE